MKKMRSLEWREARLLVLVLLLRPHGCPFGSLPFPGGIDRVGGGPREVLLLQFEHDVVHTAVLAALVLPGLPRLVAGSGTSTRDFKGVLVGKLSQGASRLVGRPLATVREALHVVNVVL